MGFAARLLRVRTLAALFGGYFALVMLLAWFFASGLKDPWYSPDLSRWAYMANLVAAAVFLAAIALFGFAVQQAFESRRREVNRELGGLLLDAGTGLSPEEVLAPPDPDSPDDSEGLGLDVILETVGEAQDQDILMVPPHTTREEALAAHRLQLALLHRRDDLQHHEHLLASFLPGPAAMAVGILGISAVMLPAADGMLQTWHQLNTTLILGIAYAWIGLAAYFTLSAVAVVASLPGQRTQSGRRIPLEAVPESRVAEPPAAGSARPPAGKASRP